MGATPTATADKVAAHPLTSRRPLGRGGRATRLILSAAALVTLVIGSIVGTRDMFPFGPFTMYAGHYPINGFVTSDHLAGGVAGRPLQPIPLAAVGLTHADFEGHVPEFVHDPARLAALAAAYAARDPHAGRLTELAVTQERWQLRDRAVVRHYTVTLVRWVRR